jgi:hypothetical protein
MRRKSASFYILATVPLLPIVQFQLLLLDRSWLPATRCAIIDVTMFVSQAGLILRGACAVTNVAQRSSASAPLIQQTSFLERLSDPQTQRYWSQFAREIPADQKRSSAPSEGEL